MLSTWRTRINILKSWLALPRECNLPQSERSGKGASNLGLCPEIQCQLFVHTSYRENIFSSAIAKIQRIFSAGELRGKCPAFLVTTRNLRWRHPRFCEISSLARLLASHVFLLYFLFPGNQFDFDKMCSPTAIAHSLAIEPWSRGLFDKMRASHQSHYEQFGTISGDFRIGNHTASGIRMTSMRDHTIAGYRRWSDIRR